MIKNLYSTAKGVKVGASENNIVAEFEKPDISEAGLGELTLTYFMQGIRFPLQKTGYISSSCSRKINESLRKNIRLQNCCRYDREE